MHFGTIQACAVDFIFFSVGHNKVNRTEITIIPVELDTTHLCTHTTSAGTMSISFIKVFFLFRCDSRHRKFERNIASFVEKYRSPS